MYAKIDDMASALVRYLLKILWEVHAVFLCNGVTRFSSCPNIILSIENVNWICTDVIEFGSDLGKPTTVAIGCCRHHPGLMLQGSAYMKPAVLKA